MIAYRNREYLIKAAGGLTTLPAQPATALLRQNHIQKVYQRGVFVGYVATRKGLKALGDEKNNG